VTFDPFSTEAKAGPDQKKRAFLVGNAPGRVHFLAKMALYRGQSINCYHLENSSRAKLEGRNTPSFDSIRDEYIREGIEIDYPHDIPENDVERWVHYGRAEAAKRGLTIGK
jgi:hypothetical protein